MTDLRQFREIEKLVEDSVFHPSPRHHLRQRVLQHAIKARHRQKQWRRFAVASSVVFGTLVVGFIAVRLAAPRRSATAEAGPVRVQIYSPGHSPRATAVPSKPTVPVSSLGESAYFPARQQAPESPQAEPSQAAGAGRAIRKENKDLTANPE